MYIFESIKECASICNREYATRFTIFQVFFKQILIHTFLAYVGNLLQSK